MRAAVLFLVLCHATAGAASRHQPPPMRVRTAPIRVRPEAPPTTFASTFHSPSSLWPMAANVTLPPNPVPCTWSAVMPGLYVPGCSDGGYPCAQYNTLEEAEAACSLDYLCGGVTSQDTGLPPWETRRGPKAVASAQGEQSYVITNDCHGDGGQCWVLPTSFTVVAAEGSFVDDVLSGAMARYTSIINTAVAQTTLLPSQAQVLPGGNLTVSVVGGTAVPLAFGVDESYTLSVSAAGATLTAATVWGALRGLETASQLARHSWTTSASGAINASYNALCSVEVVDAPRFPYRGLMIDSSRHFMPVAVVKQIMELMAYLKMNALRIHLIDTQSWSYFAPDLPQASNTSAFSPLHVYYPGDLKELVAFGRARGIIVYPEVDFPSHSQVLLASVPELGCLSPGPNPYRMYIDPLFPDLWPTMDKVFRGLNAIFPPEYPFHGGGDEVDRNAWATCPSVVAWGQAQNITTGLNNAITDWWYTSFYKFLRAPPYNRVVMLWEDATDAVNASTWADVDTALILEQWNGNPGTWRSDTCSVLATNAQVLVSGPFHDVIGLPPSFNSNPEQNYADIFNLTCAVTPRVVQQLVGPELMWWDDAADISASDTILMLMSSVLPVAESGWSPQSLVAQGKVNPSRYSDMRCRLARRGMQSHDAYGHVGTFCLTEYEPILMPWSE